MSPPSPAGREPDEPTSDDPMSPGDEAPSWGPGPAEAGGGSGSSGLGASGERDPDHSGEGSGPPHADETENANQEADEAVSHTEPLSDADIRDRLPDDLDAAGYVGPYMFPNNNRRRIPAYLYWAIAAVCVVVWLVSRDDSALVNGGFLAAAVGLALIGVYSFLSGWNLDVDERDALVVATRAVGFPVGHASAQMGWRGLLSRPTWRILLYSAEEPPEKRGLVLVDGVNGDVVEWFVEDNPEDWSELSG